tara:strand:- start:415 stop:777 length:363 start_codon:yes stop_codon:yes gene_type:complete
MISSMLRLDGTPTVSLIWVNRVFRFMSPRRKGIGSQKQARFERLKLEILTFVGANPGCSAQSIVANLSHDRAMRNHGLTPRKVGFFIPRHLAQYLVWWQDHTAGRRVYGEAGCSEVPKKH